jgi:ABC-2 type transport system ATP-binding protein
MALDKENKMQESAIKVSSVHKSFKLPHERTRSVKSAFVRLFRQKNRAETQIALDGISFEVKRGEFFGIVGRNGSGKSTLLKILAGIYQPSEGAVEVSGKLVPFIELGVGFNPELTGRENVFLNGALLGFSKKEVEGMYGDIVGFAELERFMDQKLKNYSSGMQVRLAFSLAIRAQADILLIDEVLAVGDADFQRKCFDYFRQLKNSKTTVVFVSHDMNAVMEYCDRAALVDNTKLVAVGKSEEIAKRYTRLFTHASDEDVSEESPEPRRWGDGKVSVSSVAVSGRSYRAPKDDVVGLTIKVEAKEDVSSNVAVGFLIRNSAGVAVLGTNTYVQHHVIRELKKGKTIKVSWKVPNVFGDGKYYVDVAVTSTDGSVTHDWYEEAADFRVFRDEHTPYIITPSIPVEIED